jgi:hypothetical protein
MIDWEDDSVATQDVLIKQLIDTVGIVVVVAVVIAVFCLI